MRGFPVWERRLVTFPLLLVLLFILSPFMPKMATWHPTLSLGRDWQSQLEVSSPLLLCVPLFQFHSSFYHRFCNNHFIVFISPSFCFDLCPTSSLFTFPFVRPRLSLSPPSPPLCHLISRINGFISIKSPWRWIMSLIIISLGWWIVSLIRIFFFLWAKANPHVDD